MIIEQKVCVDLYLFIFIASILDAVLLDARVLNIFIDMLFSFLLYHIGYYLSAPELFCPYIQNNPVYYPK
jgi:hypothetical protein